MMEDLIEALSPILPDVREQIASSKSGDEEVVNVNSVEELGPLIDHTNLKIDATRDDLAQLVDEAGQISAASVCVHSVNVKFVAGLCSKKEKKIPVCSVVGFPSGAVSSVAKVAEASAAVADGATEIDMVIHIGAMKDKRYADVFLDVKAVRDAIPGIVLKVILETASLSDEEILLASWASTLAGADFLKTSTGFGPGGATVEAVRILRSVSSRVKASGGMKTREDCESMLAAGASRLGLSRGFGIITSNATEKGAY